MDVIKLSAAALEPIAKEGIRVQQGWYDKDLKKTHVTLWKLSETPEGHSDDGEEIEAGRVQVTIFSQRDEVELAQRIKKLMVAAGATWTGGDQDDTINDGGIYVKPQRFEFVEELT